MGLDIAFSLETDVSLEVCLKQRAKNDLIAIQLLKNTAIKSKSKYVREQPGIASSSGR
jgi:hypothetical protein